MDDRAATSSLRPSTPFDDSSASIAFHPLAPRPFTTASAPTTPPAFLPSINQMVHMQANTPFDARASMLSPPEQTPLDTFARATTNPSMEYTMKRPNAPNPTGRLVGPISPPTSPETKVISPDAPRKLSPAPARDPILYPENGESPPSQPPLFAPSRLVGEHIKARESSTFRETSPPRDSDYELALTFKSQVMQAFNSNRRLWRDREMAQLAADNLLRNGGRRYTAIAPAHTGSVRHVRPTPKISQPGSTHRVAKPPRAPKPAPGVRGATPSGDVAKRVAREDKDFNSLEDFSPDVATLPNKPHSLKVDWKGAPIDLKSDPHAHLLHPDELHLAANLRLDCATYLTSKRRIFIKRIEAYRINKEFRKTDAQQACKIDVNKASKLWQAFDKVGWLDPKYIEKYA
ncbi:hypothetical protein LZ554_009107 [Drepanopeziza brunnea f. sp. 'monogermtubi']|nr:hypothetical protein LZ554_009107 [Drepanopeziza brunnea f. sp. 'monogermtubi']